MTLLEFLQADSLFRDLVCYATSACALGMIGHHLMPDVAFSPQEAGRHSRFAMVAGVAISAAMLSFAITHQTTYRRGVDIAAMILTLLLSGAFAAFAPVAGVFQRLLWGVGFLWLVLIDLAL